MRRALLSILITILITIAITVAAAGCTFEKGRSFAHLSAELWGEWDVDPDAGGWISTTSAFELKPSRLELVLHELAAAGVTAAPQEELASAHAHLQEPPQEEHDHEAEPPPAAAAQTLAALPVPDPLALLAGAARAALTSCAPSCELGRGELNRAEATLEHLVMASTVRDAAAGERLGDATVAIEIDLPLHDLIIAGALTPPARMDRDEPHRLHLAVELALPAGLFDDIRWHELERSAGVIRIDGASNTATGAGLRTALAAGALHVTAARESE